MTHPPIGILLVDKAEGPTSHDVVDTVRKAARIRRVGHAGTLDPFASGLLLLLLGPATRLSEYFIGMDKEYDATVHLGIETRSHDRDGEVVSEVSGWRDVGADELEEALAGLRGRVSQKPPAYSAKKVRGEAAHRRVRRGESVELDPVEVEVYELKLLEMVLPEVRLGVRCSSGTYIRALARDLGRSLKVGGHLSKLRRTGIGPFSSASASSLDTLNDLEAIQASLIPPALALAHLPSIEVEMDDAARVCQGRFLSIARAEFPEETPVRVLLNGELLAIAAMEGDQLRPRKVLGSCPGNVAGSITRTGS
ncbi:MAG: tRNA pseudouridine(55) synthase TruB [Gemmatimonadota bacterium]